VLFARRPPLQRNGQNLMTPFINLPTFLLTVVRCTFRFGRLLAIPPGARLHLYWSSLWPIDRHLRLATHPPGLQRSRPVDLFLHGLQGSCPSAGESEKGFQATACKIPTALPGKTSKTAFRLAVHLLNPSKRTLPGTRQEKKNSACAIFFILMFFAASWN